MSAVISGLIGAVVAAALVGTAERRQKPARASADGWRTLRPSWLLHATLIGCAGFTALLAYFLLRGGSSRPDADTQNIYALALLIAFALGAAYLGWTSYGRSIAWQGNKLRVRTSLGGETVRLFSDISSVRKRHALGEYRIAFRDGSRLRMSAYLHGADELVSNLPVGSLED